MNHSDTSDSNENGVSCFEQHWQWQRTFINLTMHDKLDINIDMVEFISGVLIREWHLLEFTVLLWNNNIILFCFLFMCCFFDWISLDSYAFNWKEISASNSLAWCVELFSLWMVSIRRINYLACMKFVSNNTKFN